MRVHLGSSTPVTQELRLVATYGCIIWYIGFYESQGNRKEAGNCRVAFHPLSLEVVHTLRRTLSRPELVPWYYSTLRGLKNTGEQKEYLVSFTVCWGETKSIWGVEWVGVNSCIREEPGMTDDRWVVADMNSWQRDAFILDHLNFMPIVVVEHLFAFLMD